jgi:hypothetical protein
VSGPLQADPEAVIAFRLHGHHLAQRLPHRALEAAAACGTEHTPPAAGLVGLHARVTGLTAEQFRRAVAVDKTLVWSWSLRLAPFVFPAAALDTFTVGVLPEEESSWRVLLRKAGDDLDEAGIKVGDALDLTATAMQQALAGRTLGKAALSAELSRRLPGELVLWCKRCSVRHVPERLLRAAAVKSRVCFAPGPDPDPNGEIALARVEDWLGSVPPADPDAARSGLVRRFLRAYGPAAPLDLARWAEIDPVEGARRWFEVEPSLLAFELAGRRVWLHRDDISAFRAPPAPDGVRFLPPYDQFLAQNDREILVPDPQLQRRVWRQSGNPGVVLFRGGVLGVWRSTRKEGRLVVSLDAFTPTSPGVRSAVIAEAGRLAGLRGCPKVSVKFSR